MSEFEEYFDKNLDEHIKKVTQSKYKAMVEYERSLE